MSRGWLTTLVGHQGRNARLHGTEGLSDREQDAIRRESHNLYGGYGVVRARAVEAQEKAQAKKDEAKKARQAKTKATRAKNAARRQARRQRGKK